MCFQLPCNALQWHLNNIVTLHISLTLCQCYLNLSKYFLIAIAEHFF